MNTTDPSNTTKATVRPALWDIQPGESDAAYSLFLQYRDSGTDGTLDDLAQQEGKSVGAVRMMASRHRWTERAAAWRQHLAAIQSEELEGLTRKTALLWSQRTMMPP